MPRINPRSRPRPHAAASLLTTPVWLRNGAEPARDSRSSRTLPHERRDLPSATAAISATAADPNRTVLPVEPSPYCAATPCLGRRNPKAPAPAQLLCRGVPLKTAPCSGSPRLPSDPALSNGCDPRSPPQRHEKQTFSQPLLRLLVALWLAKHLPPQQQGNPLQTSAQQSTAVCGAEPPAAFQRSRLRGTPDRGIRGGVRSVQPPQRGRYRLHASLAFPRENRPVPLSSVASPAQASTQGCYLVPRHPSSCWAERASPVRSQTRHPRLNRTAIQRADPFDTKLSLLV